MIKVIVYINREVSCIKQNLRFGSAGPYCTNKTSSSSEIYKKALAVTVRNLTNCFFINHLNPLSSIVSYRSKASSKKI